MPANTAATAYNTGHATATVLMDTYAHTQDKPRLELTEKIEADFYTQDVAGAKPQEPPENKTPVATKITGKMILEAIRQMDAEERRELTRVLVAENSLFCAAKYTLCKRCKEFMAFL